MQRQCNDRLALSHHDSSPAECAAARCVHSMAFALTASAPCSSPILFSSASHFLKKDLRKNEKLQSSSKWNLTSSLGFVARHFSGKQTIEEVSENEGERFVGRGGSCVRT